MRPWSPPGATPTPAAGRAYRARRRGPARARRRPRRARLRRGLHVPGLPSAPTPRARSPPRRPVTSSPSRSQAPASRSTRPSSTSRWSTSPEAVAATLTSPDGTAVAVTLPGGGQGFNAILGRDVLVGAFDALSGGPADGIWRLSLADLDGEGRGFYVSAAAFVFGPACDADCAGPVGPRECGDDRCGGACGTCGDGAPCSVDGRCEACSPACRECGDDRCGGACGGCDDGLFCNGWEHCVLGSCSAGLTPCRVPDGLTCTSDCDETTRRCDAPAAGSCVVDGACVVEGDANPANPCEACLPAIDDTAWSPADRIACDDGDACTASDECLGRRLLEATSSTATTGTPAPMTPATARPGACRAPTTSPATTATPAPRAMPARPAPASAERPRLRRRQPLHDDACDPASGCVASPNHEPCDDSTSALRATCARPGLRGARRSTATTTTRAPPTPATPPPAALHETLDCDDHDACTADSCDLATGCDHEAVDCDDRNPCTDDRCDPSDGCVSRRNVEPCDDGDPCTADDRCAQGACAPGPDRCADDPGPDGGPGDAGEADVDGGQMRHDGGCDCGAAGRARPGPPRPSSRSPSRFSPYPDGVCRVRSHV
ncbi:MAG: hypothetical protein MZW92_71000 [Comamonadaceae bacterium]|nr:hypothetical protein [Comamonadaceae bacterium]